MDHSTVLGSILPLVLRELGDVSTTDVLVSLAAVKAWQLRHRPDEVLPGTPLGSLDVGCINEAYHFLRFALGGYGWKGEHGCVQEVYFDCSSNRDGSVPS